MIRIAKIAIAAMATAGASVAAAQVSVAPLAPNEVLLEVASSGIAHNRADKVVVQVMVSASAPTSAEARRDVAAQVDRLTTAARAQGVSVDDIKVVHPQRSGFIGNEAFDVPDEALRLQKKVAMTAIEIRVRDPNRFPALREALEGAGAANVGDPEFGLGDDHVALEQAKADALSKGRAEAEAYARSLGLRIVRVARVSERSNTETLSVEMMQDMIRRLSGSVSADADVETKVTIAMDFVLGPAR